MPTSSDSRQAPHPDSCAPLGIRPLPARGRAIAYGAVSSDVIPAERSESRDPGIPAVPFFLMPGYLGPGSAAHHSVLRCARDDSRDICNAFAIALPHAGRGGASGTARDHDDGVASSSRRSRTRDPATPADTPIEGRGRVERRGNVTTKPWNPQPAPWPPPAAIGKASRHDQATGISRQHAQRYCPGKPQSESGKFRSLCSNSHDATAAARMAGCQGHA